ncbi:MAG: DUF4391 domain-containing protein [Pseudomonadota bacterium]|nr:DUF4391 domain-containing protein [Pseudomonadota bacterium]
MSTALFQYPAQATVGSRVPKSRVYRFAKPTQAVRDLIVGQVQEITWTYKLSAETINLPARDGITKIQIFRMDLKQAELDEAVLRTLDKAVAFPILFELRWQGRIKPVAAYKRPSEAEAGQQVIGGYVETGWQPAGAERAPLPLALDLSGLYTRLLRVLMPLTPRPGETLRQQAERLARIKTKEREVRQAETRLRRERQFNHKVAINAELRGLRAELKRLLE